MTYAKSTNPDGSFSRDPIETYGPVIIKGAVSQKGAREVTHEILKGRSVLLVEDSWLIAQGYKSLLEISGMDVIGPAASVPDAEELLLTTTPDLALVDINLQGNLSYDLIGTMISREIPVVIISGNDVLPAIASKVDCVLTKPIGGAALMASLRRVAAARYLAG